MGNSHSYSDENMHENVAPSAHPKQSLVAATCLPSWAKAGLPSWLEAKTMPIHTTDWIAIKCEEKHNKPFLRSPRIPAVGQNVCLDLCLNYKPDPNKKAYLVGQVVKVLPQPPPGVYGAYADQIVTLSTEDLTYLQAHLFPALPPSKWQACPCPLAHTAEHAIITDGAVHGQAVVAKLSLVAASNHSIAAKACAEDRAKEKSLKNCSGEELWDALFVMNDNCSENAWQLVSMVPVSSKFEDLA